MTFHIKGQLLQNPVSGGYNSPKPRNEKEVTVTGLLIWWHWSWVAQIHIYSILRETISSFKSTSPICFPGILKNANCQMKSNKRVYVYIDLELRVSCSVSVCWFFRWSGECSEDDVNPQHGAGQLHGHHCWGANPSPGHWSVPADLPGHPVPGPDGEHLRGPEMPKWVLLCAGWLTPTVYLLAFNNHSISSCSSVSVKVLRL